MADENPLAPNSPHDGPSGLRGLDPGELLARGLHTVKPTGGIGGWEPPTPEEVGRLLPQYRIESLIGRGGMGAVYKGIQLNLDRPVAIKLLPAEIAADAEFVTRFKREARTLARLQHSRIVTIHDFGQTAGGYLYFVMEYIDGTDLRRILKGPGLDPEQALAVVGQLCDALQAAHREGIVHRDIKPENVLITKDGYVKLADFGLSRPPQEAGAAQLTSTNVIMGTPDYMAPEQRDGAAKADHRSDIFALGVMFYEMLTGKPPRGAFDRPSLKVRVDARIDAVVIKALQSEPGRRYQQASEMKTAVDRIRSAPPLAKPAAKPVQPVAPARKSNKALLSIAAIIALVIGLSALLVGLWWTRSLGPTRKANESVVSSNPVVAPVEINSAGLSAPASPPARVPTPSSSPSTMAEKSARATPAATPKAIAKPTAPTPGIDLSHSPIGHTLLSKQWRWHNAPGKDYNELLTLRPDGTGSLEAGQKLPTGYEFHKGVRWSAVDDHTAWMVFAAKHEEFDPNKSGFWVKFNDPSPEKFFGYSDYDNSQVGFGVAESDAGKSGAPIAQAGASAAKESAVGSSLPVIVSKPGSSHLQNFIDQMPLAQAWALAPLDIVVPPSVLENATLLKTGLTVEARRRPPALQTAYTRGVYFCGLLIGILQEKETLFSRTGGRPDQRPWDGAISQWHTRAEFVRPMLEVAGKQFGEALQSAGGLPAVTDGAAESGLLATLPAMGTPFPKPPPGPFSASLQAQGPVGGTNFGWGARNLKVHVAVHTESDKPLPVTVDCYWVGWDGKHHTTSKPYHQALDVTKDHGADFEFATVALRTNGATFGILSPAPGVYRGWLITMHNAKGERVGTATNQAEFGHLVP